VSKIIKFVEVIEEKCKLFFPDTV